MSFTCPRCGAALVLHRERGTFWACERRRRGCTFGFAAAGDGTPLRVSLHQAPDREGEVAEIKEQLLVLAKQRLPRGTADYEVVRDVDGELDGSAPATYYLCLGQILDAEDVVTLGNLRRSLDGGP